MQIKEIDVSGVDQSGNLVSVFILGSKQSDKCVVRYNGNQVQDFVLAVPHLSLLILQERDYRTGELVPAEETQYRIVGMHFGQAGEALPNHTFYCDLKAHVALLELHGKVEIEFKGQPDAH